MCHGVITQGKNRMRQFRTSGSVRGAAREGGSYRDKIQGWETEPEVDYKSSETVER